MTHSKKFMTAALFLLLSGSFVSGQEQISQTGSIKSTASIDITTTIPNWVVVLTGKVLCEPVRLSYGYIVFSEGNVLTAFTQDGTILRQKNLGAGVKPYISATFNDMLYIASKSKCLSLMNPTWKNVWNCWLDFDITHSPLPGRDGRVFVNGNSDIACIDTAGIIKWTAHVNEIDNSLGPLQMNDGSLLVFMKEKDNGNTTALRYSPFGQLMEKVTFDGIVKQADSCSNGILVAFEDGSAGMCSAGKDATSTKWSLASSTKELSKPTVISSRYFPEGQAVIVSGSPARVTIISTADGSIRNSFYTPSINTQTLQYTFNTSQGIILADSRHIDLFDSQGGFQWEASTGSKKNWNYLFATDNGYLTLCQNNWVIQSYRMKQGVGKTTSAMKEMKSASYSDFYTPLYASNNLTGRMLSDDQIKEMHTLLKNGSIGEKEQFYLSALDVEMNAIIEDWGNGTIEKTRELSFFEGNMEYTEEILTLAAESNTLLFHNYFSTLLTDVTDSTLLPFIVRAAAKCAYDPEQKILTSLDYIIKYKASSRDLTLLRSICDTTYAICAFMGKPAFLAHGKEILATLLYPQYSSNTREYARKTLAKINELSM